MNINIDELIENYIKNPIQVQGVYHHKIEPGKVGFQRSAPYPGFIFPLSGKAQFHFNGTPYLAGVGNIIHGGANMNLDKRVVGNRRWEYITVLYDIYSPEQKDVYLQNTHFELNIGQSPRLIELLWRLCRSYNQRSSISAFQSETLFRCALEEVFVCWCNKGHSSAQALFDQVSSYIQNHYMDTLTVRDLAEQNGVNENRLFYVFNKYAGVGPGDYLIELRINRAKELLINCNASVGDVADSVGYSDALYFSRIFKRRVGISPSGFRKKFSNNPYEFQDTCIQI